jgi:hypothetical protein
VRFAPIAGRQDPPDTPLSAELMLRPTIDHPDLSGVLGDADHTAMHLKLLREPDGRPVDALHVHGYAQPEEAELVKKAIWSRLGLDTPPPPGLGRYGEGERASRWRSHSSSSCSTCSTSLAISPICADQTLVPSFGGTKVLTRSDA